MRDKNTNGPQSLPQPWRIVPPAIMFNLIFLLTSCASVALTFGGLSAFCSSIGSQLNVSGCEDLIGYQWYRYPNATFFYDDLVIAETGATVGLIGWLMGFIILLIRVITHADFQVIPPGSGKSVASQIATNGTTQSPLGHSMVAQTAISVSSLEGEQRSSSTSDITTTVSETPKRPYRKRTMSTGNDGSMEKRSNNNNKKSFSTTHPIVINNHHHLHLHCHCRIGKGVKTNQINATSQCGDTPDTLSEAGGVVSLPACEITHVNEVEPLLSSPSIPAPGNRNQKL